MIIYIQRSLSMIIFMLLFLLPGCESSLPPESNNVDYTGQKDTITDIDGNVYKTIGIGSQIWMAENLMTTRLSDGRNIIPVPKITEWTRSDTISYCWYNNDSISNSRIYGALYNYYTVETGLLCPTGWHVPTDSEWRILINFVGGKDVAAGKLKDLMFWSGPNVCYTHQYDFFARAGGIRRRFSSQYMEQGTRGYWWNSGDEKTIMSTNMINNTTSVSITGRNRFDGCSVRCVKDKL